MKIGIFDSGIGGATVLKEIFKLLPNEEYIYYSDSKNNPYGDKSQKEIINFSENIVNFLIKQECEIIVIACNTASANAASYLRAKYSTIPIVAIEPAYKMVNDYAINDAALVLATKATIESEKFTKLYQTYDNNKTTILECVGLADLIENEKNLEIDKYLQKYLSKYSGKVKSVVLGCTHYPLIQDKIRKVLGEEIKIFDGAVGLANNLKNIVQSRNYSHSSNPSVIFFDSSNSKEKEERFYQYLNL